MSRRRLAGLGFAAVLLAGLIPLGAIRDGGGGLVLPPPEASRLAIPFAENIGQLPPSVRFAAGTFAGAVHVTSGGDLVYALPARDGDAPDGVCLLERLENAAPMAVTGLDPSPTQVHVFRGQDRSQWWQGIPTFASVAVGATRAGARLEVRASAHNVEKLFRVPPGVDPGTVRMRVEGAESLAVGARGELEVATAAGIVRFTEPVAYQEREGRRLPVEAAYAVDGCSYGFRVGEHDRTLPLVIDPLIGSTYLGAENNDWGEDIDVYWLTGEVYVAGYTDSPAFPTTQGAAQGAYLGGTDAFVAQFSPDLTTLLSCTYLGGMGWDRANAVSVSGRGVWVAGETDSEDFPTTPGVIAPDQPGSKDGWVAKFSLDLGTLEASTYHGGSGYDGVSDMVAAGGAIYIAGDTRSDDLWFSEGALQQQLNGTIDVFFATMNERLDQISFQSLLGGSSSESVSRITAAEGIVIAVGETYSEDFPTTPGAYSRTKAGEQGLWVTVIQEDYSQLIASTYLGGTAEFSEIENVTGVYEWYDRIYVCGHTNAVDFPTTEGAYDRTFNVDFYEEAFVCAFDHDLTTLVASTLLGGSRSDAAYGIHCDLDNVYVVGSTGSGDFPHLSDIPQVPDGGTDVFAATFDHDLTELTGAASFGSLSSDEPRAVTVREGVLYMTGHARAEGFPTTSGAYDETYNAFGLRADAFVTSLTLGEDEEPPPPETIDSFILPKKVNVKHKDNVKKSRVAAVGWFDTGSAPFDFGDPATLTVGDAVFPFPELPLIRKGVYKYVLGGVMLKIKPSKHGSSRAKFRMKIRGQDAEAVDPNAPLKVRFQSGPVDGSGTVDLKEGRYKLGRLRGALLEPHLCVFNCRTKLKGLSKDKVSVKLGLATGQGTPDKAPDFTLWVGDTFVQTVPSASFERDGDRYKFKGPKGALTSVKLDYRKERILAKGKALDAGAFPEGAQPVLIRVKVGDQEEYSVRVRMVRSGKSMRY